MDDCFEFLNTVEDAINAGKRINVRGVIESLRSQLMALCTTNLAGIPINISMNWTAFGQIMRAIDMPIIQLMCIDSSAINSVLQGLCRRSDTQLVLIDEVIESGAFYCVHCKNSRHPRIDQPSKYILLANIGLGYCMWVVLGHFLRVIPLIHFFLQAKKSQQDQYMRNKPA